MKVLLVGNGAREHAIAEALTKSGRVKLATFAKATNPGIKELSQEYGLGSLKDFKAIADFARAVKPDFAVIGPDDPIADGVADLLIEQGIKSVAPLKTCARLESSKSFARDLVEKYEIPGNPKFRVFTSGDPASELNKFIEQLGGNYVVKADGLMGGKGVKVSGEHLHSIEEGVAWATECITKAGRVVIEEKLIGQEFSLMSFVSGTQLSNMPAVQDHKRAFEGDTGPNTGGMGTYSDANHLLPFLKKNDIEAAHAITEKVAAAILKETGVAYKGIMYGGFMAVKNGVRLIEYNARFGDPEGMNVLPIMKTDFVEVCEAILAGRLDKLRVEFENKATVCKYVVPEGYPDNPKNGEKIVVQQKSVASPELRMYYSSVDQRGDGLYLSGSRAIAFVGIADSIAEAEKIAEAGCVSVTGSVFHRKDIGTQALIQKRVEMMKIIRS